jgi:hypothetical protein
LPVGEYARNWLNMVGPGMSYFTQALDQSYSGKALGFDDLPLDYYAPGPAYFYSRNQWGPSATNIFFQLGQVSGVPLTHLDAGTFQIWRNGYYLSKESTGYDLYFNGGWSDETISKNGLLVNHLGEVRAYQDYSPQVLRLQSSDDFSYAAVDLTGTYRSHSHPSLDNPSVGRVIREFIYIRPLDTMLILDKINSTDEEMPAADVQKTFLLHFPNEPWRDGPNSFMSQNGDQVLRLTSLGQTPNFNVVDEGNFEGYHDASSYYQYRLEATLSGRAQSYFLNVLQFRDETESNVVAGMTEDSRSWTITLDHPKLGHAVIVLNKGTDSVGGAIGYSPDQYPNNLVPLTDHVQSIQVTDNGPVWGL